MILWWVGIVLLVLWLAFNVLVTSVHLLNMVLLSLCLYGGRETYVKLQKAIKEHLERCVVHNQCGLEAGRYHRFIDRLYWYSYKIMGSWTLVPGYSLRCFCNFSTGIPLFEMLRRR